MNFSHGNLIAPHEKNRIIRSCKKRNNNVKNTLFQVIKTVKGNIFMGIFNRTHAFIWNSMSVNNCNTYLIEGPTRVLIDPGHLSLFNENVRKELGNLGIGMEDIGLVICTHSHPDHLEAVQLFREKPALTAIHEEEWKLVKSMEQYVNTFGVRLDSIVPDFFLKQGQLSVNGLEFKIIHTPGHSPGSVCIYWPEEKALFTGDLIFKEGVGRTDLPGGDGSLLKESILRLADLEVECILPGHGDIVSGAAEVKNTFSHLQQFWFQHI